MQLVRDPAQNSEATWLAASQGLMTVNKRLAAVASNDSHVTYLDCGQPFFASPTELNHDLLPDALHPSAAGNVTFEFAPVLTAA